MNNMNTVEDMRDVEKLARLEKVKKHVRNNRVPVDNTRVKCVDGGYQKGQAEGAMAIPGGHLGISMTLVAMGYEPGRAFELVKEFATRRGEKYGWHSDAHTEHPHGEEEHQHDVGCGHCDKAISQAQFYGADGGQIKELLQLVRDAGQQPGTGAEMDYVELDRDHTEQGILVVDGLASTVRPWEKDELTDSQFFIYDRVRHQHYLKELVEFLTEKAQADTIDYDALWATSWKQTQSTLGLLGTSKGAPMYLVNVDSENEDEWVIDEIGNAPKEATPWTT